MISEQQAALLAQPKTAVIGGQSRQGRATTHGRLVCLGWQRLLLFYLEGPCEICEHETQSRHITPCRGLGYLYVCRGLWASGDY